MPNGAGEKFRWGDWREPLRLSTRKGWVQGRPLIRPSVRTGAPSPRGEGFGLCFPSRLRNHPSQPAQLVGGPLRAWDKWAAGQAKKEGGPRRVPPTRKGGSREEESLPPWCSFLRLSSKESRAPARSRAGNHVAGPTLRRSKPRPPARGSTRLRTLQVGGSEDTLGRSAPLPRRPSIIGRWLRWNRCRVDPAT